MLSCCNVFCVIYFSRRKLQYSTNCNSWHHIYNLNYYLYVHYGKTKQKQELYSENYSQSQRSKIEIQPLFNI